MIFELNEDDEKTLDSLLAIWLEGNLQAHSFISKNYWLDNLVGVREGLAQARIFVKETDGKAVGFFRVSRRRDCRIICQRAISKTRNW